VYLALVAASVPWYMPQGPLRLWLGLPHWVVVSIGAMAAVAAFTVFVVHRYWPELEDEPARDPLRDGRR
jgi:hypothetical protein